MKKQLHSLFLIIFFDQISLNITFPILSFVFFDPATSLFASTVSTAERSFWYGICLALAYAGNLISCPLLSWLSDIWGRRRLLLLAIWGALVYATFSAAGVLYGSLLLLLFGKLTGGFFARTDPLAQAIVADLSEPQNRVTRMSHLQAVIAMGACIGPILGGYCAKTFFTQLNFSFPFLVAMIFAIIAIALTFTVFQETHHERVNAKKINWLEIKSLFTPKLMIVSLVLVLVQISWSTYYQFMPAMIKSELHFTAPRVGLFVGLVALWLTLASIFFVKKMQARWNEKEIIFYSMLAMLSGFVLEMLAIFFQRTQFGVVLTWLSAIPIAMGDVIAYSALIALYANAVSSAEHGKVMGFSFILVAATWMLTALLGGLLGAISINLPLLIAPIGLILALRFVNKIPIHIQ